MSDLDKELEAVLQRRKTVRSELERLKGRQEQAEANLKVIEEECRSKKIDPDRIDETLTQLESRYTALVEQLKRDTEKAEAELAPYLKGQDSIL